MFLSKTLEGKIKQNSIENKCESFLPKAKYAVQPRERNLKILFPSKPNPISNLNLMSKSEWENTFSLKQLQTKWNAKVELNHETKHKKFPSEVISKQALQSKQYINTLVDPDILELNQKRWNNSGSFDNQFRSEIKETLFNINHGLKDFKVTTLKEPLVSEGTNSRNQIFINGKSWSVSAKLEDKEKKELSNDTQSKATLNSLYYWKTNAEDRKQAKSFLVSEDRRKLEVIRYFKKYRTPNQKLQDLYNTMNKVKQLTQDERALVEKKVKYKNPGALDNKERINAIVHKEMYSLYRDRYNELIGNLAKNELRKRQLAKNKFKWNEKDLVNKMLLLDSLDEKELKWFKPNYKIISQSLPNIKKEVLKTLVPQGNSIYLEEERLKEEADEKERNRLKRELLIKQKCFPNRVLYVQNIFVSKYPMSKEDYAKDNKRSNGATINEIKQVEKEAKEYTINNDLDKYFFESYKNVTDRILKERDNNLKKNNDIGYKYSHPGIYREFIFNSITTENKNNKKIVLKIQNKSNEEEDNITSNTKEDEYQKDNKRRKNLPSSLVTKFNDEKDNIIKAWSCCMNSDEKSKGCEFKRLNKYIKLFQKQKNT